MDTINNKLELALSLVLDTLQVYKGVKLLDEAARNTNIVKIDVQKNNTTFTVAGFELSQSAECLVSIFDKDSKLDIESIILGYEKELGIGENLKYPLKFQDYCKMYDTSKVCILIYKKFNNETLMIRGTSKERTNKDNVIKEESKKEEPVESNIRKEPDDMPKFEDEYEIINPDQRSDRYPGLNLPEKSGDTGKLGNPDLYPMGQKDPFNFNDINTRGGMSFDPFGKNQSNMQGDKQDLRNRGPGWIPGSKFDDPFGRNHNDTNPGSGFGGGFNGGMFM